MARPKTPTLIPFEEIRRLYESGLTCAQVGIALDRKRANALAMQPEERMIAA